MKLTLANMLQTPTMENNCMITLKTGLMRMKKKGEVFFATKLSELGEFQHFEMYLVQTPTENCEINAFPVPISCFCSFMNKKERFGYLGQFFKNYYGEERDWNEQLFEEYDNHRPYVADKFVWYFKK